MRTNVGALLRAIDLYQGSPITKAALKLAALTFTRAGELRAAEWDEINFETAEWRVPAERTKLHEQHIVPLSAQALEVLREIQPLTGDGRFIFPSKHTASRCLSERAINAALRKIGFSEVTAHSFYGMASTRLHELGFRHEAIERQLARAERDKISAAYDGDYLPERRRMMVQWAHFLDTVRDDVTEAAS